MNCSRIAIGAAAVACAANVAHAGFVGYETDFSTTGGGLTVARVYARFDSLNDVVLSVFGVQGFGSTDWNDADLAGGSWSPQFVTDAATDSYVTIGGSPGFANTTAADPSWGGAGFNQVGIPNGAGWFNSNPPTLQGKVDANGRTLLAQFVAIPGIIYPPGSPLTISFNQGLGTPTQFGQGSFTFLPAPGAVALLGLGALTRGRRRVG